MVTIGTTVERSRVVASAGPDGPSEEACPGQEQPQGTLAEAKVESGLTQAWSDLFGGGLLERHLPAM